MKNASLGLTAGLALVALVALASPLSAQDSFGGQPQPQPQPRPAPAGQAQPDPQAPGAYPPQSGQYPQQPGQYPQQPGNQGGMQGPDLDQLGQMERQDFGVAPINSLHDGQMHGPTPASIPGGQVITTKGIVELAQGSNQQTPYIMFDVLGGPQTLPGAYPLAWASQPGSFNDQTQQQLGQLMQQGTQGRKDIPLIFYCLSNQCWMSYNAALRAINLGYTNVLWYRGGIEAWQMAGLPTTPPGGNQQGQQQGGYPQQPPPQQPPQGNYP